MVTYAFDLWFVEGDEFQCISHVNGFHLFSKYLKLNLS